MQTRVAVVQMNATVGDLTGNRRLIEQAARQAHAAGCRLVLTPELSLTGYPPEDLLLRPAFLRDVRRALDDLAAALADLPGLRVIVGHPDASPKGCVNAASVFEAGRCIGRYAKQALPNYDVFDEHRYFTPGTEPLVFEHEGLRLGVVICEDAWFPQAPQQARQSGAQTLLVLNGSPFHRGKTRQRIDRLRESCSRIGLPVVYANLVGGQDELVFDGGSFALNAAGDLCWRAVQFEPALGVIELDAGGNVLNSACAPELCEEQQVWRALVLGVRDYVGKNRFPGAIIGLSGGVDSALTLAVAVDALGADRVRAVMMPSRYTAEISWVDSRDMVARLGVQYDEIAIAPAFDALLQMLAPQFEGLAPDATEENLQARVRGTLLMALSNKTGRIVLTTGNKSELATGYCTLYGDMAGGFAVIKDLTKTWVYRVCRWRNAQSPVIPERILTRAPSAELRPDQTDQDSLPPYDVLDTILERYMEGHEPAEQLLADGLPRAAVEQVIRLLRINEYKRRQAPVGIRITQRGFGRDWRYPITNRYFESLTGE
jgi:NAD+ synthase (glutamine-hydrolysing)